jgi:glycosyltransferase involved in cell wall biosynthesis
VRDEARELATNSSRPLATVAMVTYNSERYVATAIESVLCQSYENLELLICDDHSADATWEIVKSYGDSRIRTHRNETTLGEYPNRNRALELAQGEYIIYIDGDDILYPHGLEFMVRMLEAFPDSAMAMARPWSETVVYPVEIDSREFFLSQFLGSGVSAINFAHLLLRTSVLRDVGGLETRYSSGDTHVQYKIARDHKSLLISDGLAWWRRSPGQASEKMLRDHVLQLESLAYLNDALEDPRCPLTPAEIERARANLYGGFIRLVFRDALRGRLGHAIELLGKAKLPLRAWKYAFVPGDYSHPAGVTASRPLTSTLRQNPFARFPAL